MNELVNDPEFKSVYEKLMALFSTNPTDTHLSYAINMLAQLSRKYGGNV